ncbi:MAG: peptidylprolyl isomerase [Pseudomonadota bacterium]
MKTAEPGDFVTVIYDGFLENGEIFETSRDSGPLEFQIGTGSVLTGFEKGILGMAPEESREILLTPEDAHGFHLPELVHTVKRSCWDPKADIRPGVVVGMSMEKDGENHQVPAMITDISGDMVTIDFNHPLAGQNITYKITLQKISSAKPAAPVASGGCGCSS